VTPPAAGPLYEHCTRRIEAELYQRSHLSEQAKPMLASRLSVGRLMHGRHAACPFPGVMWLLSVVVDQTVVPTDVAAGQRLA
jgi:hypothetical protein